ncbi:MAG: aldo/keto reductase [Deltaproteobacteria bacterium]|nr:aldo/keto reductase [Deltaproteobacteria bacterium]
MRYLKLGNTGLEVSEVGFGCIPIIRLSTTEAVKVLKRAVDQGITLFDSAHMYLDSEEKMGLAFDGIRNKLVLATKSLKRDFAGVEADINLSLKRLRTDYIDLFQIHQLSLEEDYQAAIGPDGILEAIHQARQVGKIRHIGVTSHSIEMAVKLIKTGLFSTVQFPFNFIEFKPVEELHPSARQEGMGILAMKPFAGGVLDDAQLCFKFLRRFPDVIPLPGFDAVEQVDQIVAIYDTENEVRPEDLAAMEKYRAELGQKFCRRCEYCQPCEQGVMITAAMGYPVIARRMSGPIAAGFMPKAMISIRNCTECGECLQRCPYNLPIPEMLKKHLALYEQDAVGL